MWDSIESDLADTYAMRCASVEPIGGGWLNRKWKIVCDGEAYLVKQFSRERYTDAKLCDIDAALRRHMFAWDGGIRCPRILCPDGAPMRRLPNGVCYMVMTFCPGETIGPATATTARLRSLGRACGLLHERFSQLSPQGVKGYPLQADVVLEGLRAHIGKSLQIVDAPAGFSSVVAEQASILREIRPEWLECLPVGIAHEDFSPDNMLFVAEELTSILDFDRSQFSYLWHDIGRALLSLALSNGRFDASLARAFAEGYCCFRTLAPHDLADALRVTFVLETPWWITPGMFADCSLKPARFREEIVWLTRNWSEIDAIVSA